MILSVYCIRDRQTASFGNPMFLVNDGQANRSFADEINREDKDNMLYRHSDDFDLYKLGTWDSESGLFACQVPEQLTLGKQVKLK